MKKREHILGLSASHYLISETDILYAPVSGFKLFPLESLMDAVEGI